VFRSGNWQLINPDDPEALQQPLSGLYLLIGGQATMTVYGSSWGTPTATGCGAPSTGRGTPAT
jgi:hypothetical protein